MATSPRTTTAAPTPEEAGTRDHMSKLHQRQSELVSVMRRRLRGTPPGTVDEGLDEEEHAEADTQEHVEVALLQMKEETVKRLREALERLETGGYGHCADCDGQISEPRLRALPFAVRCLDCERLHEQWTDRDRRRGMTGMSQLIVAEHAGV